MPPEREPTGCAGGGAQSHTFGQAAHEIRVARCTAPQWRLAQGAEHEVGEEAQTSVTMIRDFFYMPFVAVGRRISETYAQFNIISRFLDMFVELPLKTILGFVRRWGSFLSAKKDSF